MAFSSGTFSLLYRFGTPSRADINRWLQLDANNSDIATGLTTVHGRTREKLTANRTYYVRTDGSDSNDGLADTAGGAFLTIQKAINVCKTIDINGFAVTIQVADGTYTGAVAVDSAFVGGTVTLQGNTTTPANCIISTTNSSAVAVTNSGTVLYIKGFKIATTTSGHGIIARYGSSVNINGAMNYGAVADNQLIAQYSSVINITAAYTVSAAATRHLYQSDGGVLNFTDSGGFTITVSNTPSMGVFAGADRGGVINIYNCTFSGSATGTRYSISLNAVVNTGGGGANFFPGDAAGSAATGAQYA